jgi:hypothetical protein
MTMTPRLSPFAANARRYDETEGGDHA